MPIIQLPEPEIPDVYSLGFDNSLSRVAAPQSSSAVYNSIEGAVNAQQIASGSNIAAGALVGGTVAETVTNRAGLPYGNYVFTGGPNDGLTAAAGGGTASRGVGITFLNNGTPAKLSSGNFHGNSTTVDWDNSHEVIMRIKFGSAGAAQDAFIGLLLNSAALPTNGALTTRHIGFIVDDATVYASNANDTTQTTTNISSLLTKTSDNTYRIVFEAPTRITFYVNNVVVATHWSNIPTGGTDPPNLVFGITNQSMDISNGYIWSVTSI